MPKNPPVLFDSYFGKRNIFKAIELYDHITEGVFTTGDTGITRRNINYWDNEGLLLTTREEGEGWRSYSFLEYVWLQIINRLRSIGYPISGIKKLKEGLFEVTLVEHAASFLKENPQILDGLDPKEKTIVKNALKKANFEASAYADMPPPLAILITDSLLEKNNISLLVFADGSYIIHFIGKENFYPPDELERMIYGTYAKVSLTDIIKDFLSENLTADFLPKLGILPPNEAKLMEIIHSGDYDSITIHFKDKKMDSLELHKKQNVKKRIVDILQENKYQDIVIKTHQGVITTIQNTVKLKV